MPPDLGERKRCDVDFLPSLQNSTCAHKPKGLVRSFKCRAAFKCNHNIMSFTKVVNF